MIRKLHTKLTDFEAKIALAKVGILHANLIHPGNFKYILRQIEKSLPTTLALPFPASDIDSYIPIVKPRVVHKDTTYHFLIYIPLLHVAHAFDVFKYFGYEVPHSSKNMSLRYASPTKDYIMISKNGRQLKTRKFSLVYCQVPHSASSMSRRILCRRQLPAS